MTACTGRTYPTRMHSADRLHAVHNLTDRMVPQGEMVSISVKNRPLSIPPTHEMIDQGARDSVRPPPPRMAAVGERSYLPSRTTLPEQPMHYRLSGVRKGSAAVRRSSRPLMSSRSGGMASGNTPIWKMLPRRSRRRGSCHVRYRDRGAWHEPGTLLLMLAVVVVTLVTAFSFRCFVQARSLQGIVAHPNTSSGVTQDPVPYLGGPGAVRGAAPRTRRAWADDRP